MGGVEEVWNERGGKQNKTVEKQQTEIMVDSTHPPSQTLTSLNPIVDETSQKVLGVGLEGSCERRDLRPVPTQEDSLLSRSANKPHRTQGERNATEGRGGVTRRLRLNVETKKQNKLHTSFQYFYRIQVSLTTLVLYLFFFQKE